MGWLEWTGWAGISGVISLAALVAALVVTYIELRAWWLSPRNVDVNIRVEATGPGVYGERLVFRVRVTGRSVLNEVTVRRIGGGWGHEVLGETIPVLEARDGEIEREAWFTPGTSPTYFIVSWWEQNRFGSRVHALRFGAQGAGQGLERWRQYRFPFLHDLDGRWVKEEAHAGRGMRGIYWPVDELP